MHFQILLNWWVFHDLTYRRTYCISFMYDKTMIHFFIWKVMACTKTFPRHSSRRDRLHIGFTRSTDFHNAGSIRVKYSSIWRSQVARNDHKSKQTNDEKSLTRFVTERALACKVPIKQTHNFYRYKSRFKCCIPILFFQVVFWIWRRWFIGFLQTLVRYCQWIQMKHAGLKMGQRQGLLFMAWESSTLLENLNIVLLVSKEKLSTIYTVLYLMIFILHFYGWLFYQIPVLQNIGFHDEQPDIADNSFGTSFKFLPFRRAVAKMGIWLRKQRVVIALFYFFKINHT